PIKYASLFSWKKDNWNDEDFEDQPVFERIESERSVIADLFHAKAHDKNLPLSKSLVDDHRTGRAVSGRLDFDHDYDAVESLKETLAENILGISKPKELYSLLQEAGLDVFADGRRLPPPLTQKAQFPSLMNPTGGHLTEKT